MSRLLLALCLVAALGGCHRKKAHGPSPTGGTPFLAVKATRISFNDFVKGTQFAVQGSGCKKLQATLLRITAEGSSAVTDRTFELLPETFEGNLWLLVQSGEPFGKKDQRSYSLGEAIPAGMKTQSSAAPAIFEGPYSVESEHTQTNALQIASQEYVVYARCMMKAHDNHSIGSGGLDYLKKHAAETKDEIIAVTIRWEK